MTLLQLTSDKKKALAITVIYGFATSTWSFTSQGLWQPSASQPMLALTLYFLIKAKQDPRNVIWASIPLALAVASRPPVLIFGVVFFFYVLFQHRGLIIYFSIFPAVFGSLLLTYNLYFFGTLMGGYATVAYTGYGSTVSNFIVPTWRSLLGPLFSPNRGMLIISPVLIFGWVGLFLTLRHRHSHSIVLWYTAIATVLTVAFYTTWNFWHGHGPFAYRHLVDLLPGLSLFMALTWDWVFANKWRIALFAGLAAFSLFIQVVGSFFVPCGWYEAPLLAAQHPERFWDWADMEFVRCLKAGPVNPQGLQFIREVALK